MYHGDALHTCASTYIKFLSSQIRILALSTPDFLGGKLTETMVTFPVLGPVWTSQEVFPLSYFSRAAQEFLPPTSGWEEFSRYFS